MADRPPMNALPDDVNLSHEAGEALRNRLQANPLTSEDRWMADRPPMNALPDDVNLSHEEGEALRNRLQANPLTSEDRWRLVKLIQGYCGFTFARCETKSRLRWLKRALLGEGPRPLPTDGGEAWAGADAGLTTAAGGALRAAGSAAPIEEPAGATRAPSAPVRRGGQGRQGADADAGGARVLWPAGGVSRGAAGSGRWSRDLVSVTGRGSDSN